MADRMTYPIAGSLTRGLTILAGSWAIGSTGAVGTKTCGEGMTLTRTDVGDYTITFADKYVALAYVDVQLKQATPTDLDAKVVEFTGAPVTTAKITCSVEDHTDGSIDPTDPASGDQLFVLAIVKNAS